MKKLFFIPFLALMLVFVSCEKEDVVMITTYQVFNNAEPYHTDLDPYLDGSMYEVIVFCFAGDDIVREDSYSKIAIGEKTAMKEVSEAITKIKVSFKFIPKESDYYNISSNNRKYVVSYTLIEKGKNVVSEVNGDSMMKGSLIKSVDLSVDSE